MNFTEIRQVLSFIDTKVIDIKKFIEDQINHRMSIMSKMPDNRIIHIVLLTDEITIPTSDTVHVYYNKSFLYVQNEEDDTMSIYPISQVVSIQDMPIDYSSSTDDVDWELK